MIEIWTDGSCRGNPGPGGWGYVAVENNKIIGAKQGTHDDTTNNRMEITAILQALVDYCQGEYEIEVVIYSDSAYCVNMYNNWIDGWRNNGWVRSKNQPIENLDLVKQLYKLKGICSEPKWGHYTSVKKVPGHSGVKYNEVADALATGKTTVEEVMKLG